MVQTTTQPASCRLASTQLAQFDRDGYLVVEGFFDEGDLQPVIDEIEAEVNARADRLVAQGQLSQTFREQGFEH